MKLENGNARILKGFHNLALCSVFAMWAALTFSPALVEISFVTALIGWVLWKIPQKFQISPIPKIIWIPLAGFLIWTLLAWAASEYPAKSFRGITKILQQVLIFVMAADLLKSRQDLRRFEKFFLFVAWVIFTDGIFQYCFGRDFIRGHWSEHSTAGFRIAASFGTYGKFASYLIGTIPYLGVLAFYFRNAMKDSKRCYLTLLVFGGYLLLLFCTRSRGALLAFGAALFFMLLLKRKFLWLLIFVVGIIGVAPLVPRNVVIHLDAELKEQSLVERYYLWQRAIHVIRAKPILGTGVNTYAVAHQKYDQTQNWRVRNYYAHNGYLQLAAETGLPGLFFFLMFLGGYFLYSFRSFEEAAWNCRLRTGLLTGLISFLVFSSVDTVLHNPQPVMTFWFLMGLQLAYRHSEKEKNYGFGSAFLPERKNQLE